MKKLTQQQMGFVLDYVNEIPQGQAYMAHYKVKSLAVADAAASRLLSNVKIQVYLEELRQKMEDEAIADPIERRQILSEIARGDLLDYQEVGADGGYLSIDKESPNTKAISEITSRTEYDKDGANAALITKVKLHSPTQAIDLLNKMDKLYTDGATVLNDNRTLTINVASEKAKDITQRLIAGERTSGDNGHKDL